MLGRSVRFRGSFERTEQVVVYGDVDATLPAGALHVADGGVFRGQANVESATIAGHFAGTLVVGGRLTVTASGTVTGTVRYAELAVEAGGEVSGDVARSEARNGGAEVLADGPEEREGTSVGDDTRTPALA